MCVSKGLTVLDMVSVWAWPSFSIKRAAIEKLSSVSGPLNTFGEAIEKIALFKACSAEGRG